MVTILFVGHLFDRAEVHRSMTSPIKSTLDLRSELTKHPFQSYECDFGRVEGCVRDERIQCRHRRR